MSAFSWLEIQAVLITLVSTTVGLGTKREAASLSFSVGLGVFLEGIATNFRGNSLKKKQPYNINRGGKNTESSFHISSASS